MSEEALTRYKLVQERMLRAADRARRDPATIQLLAVTKKFPPEIVREAYSLGMRQFGENYVQEFELKQPALADLKDARFHLIGHLQSNKARKAADIFQVVQTIDSVKLTERLDGMNTKLDAMIEVKLSDEESKHGAAPEQIEDIAAAIRGSKNLTLRGLMTIPPWSEDPEAPRPYFRQLRELNDRFALDLSLRNFHVPIDYRVEHLLPEPLPDLFGYHAVHASSALKHRYQDTEQLGLNL